MKNPIGIVLGALACAGWLAHGQIISLGDPVTGAYYNAGSEVFPASNITDGRYGDSGSPSDWSFWLAPQGQFGSAVINLQGDYDVTGFDIQDTHNRGYGDRGTDAFDIGVSQDGVHFTTVLVSSFTQSQWQNLPIVNFTLSSPVEARYVEFNVDSLYGGASGGINELDVLGAVASARVPDAGSSVALLCTALLGLSAVSRRFRR